MFELHLERNGNARDVIDHAHFSFIYQCFLWLYTLARRINTFYRLVSSDQYLCQSLSEVPSSVVFTKLTMEMLNFLFGLPCYNLVT